MYLKLLHKCAPIKGNINKPVPKRCKQTFIVVTMAMKSSAIMFCFSYVCELILSFVSRKDSRRALKLVSGYFLDSTNSTGIKGTRVNANTFSNCKSRAGSSCASTNCQFNDEFFMYHRGDKNMEGHS